MTDTHDIVSTPTSTLKQRKLSSSDYTTPTKSNQLDGLTDDGDRFHVPDTLNTVNTFLPVNIGIGSAATIFLLCCSAYSVVFCDFNKWFHIIWFFIFRISYDVGLGVLLRQQSESRLITKWYIKHRTRSTSVQNRTVQQQLLDHLAAYQLHASLRDTVMSYPVDFRAWLVYKSLVNFILVQDGLNYLLLAVKLWKLPHEFSLLLVLQYVVGILLSVFNFWAKQDAHRCIGEFSWYWGDFFFRKQGDLVFDGIFELFPHPMYTVGYSLYYGLSLLSRSYTLLFVSLTAHAMQLIFLFVVEEPHIERTYGKPPRPDQSNNKAIKQLYHTSNEQLTDSVFYHNLSITRLSDACLMLLSVYVIVVSLLLTDNKWLTVLHVLIWRGVHWLGLGTLLWLQSTRQWVTRRYALQGYTLADTFSYWKGIYNTSYTINILVFVCSAVHYIDVTWSDLTSPSAAARMVVGSILIGINVWSYMSTYEAVGNFGWYYGDFFVQQTSYTTGHNMHSGNSSSSSSSSGKLTASQAATQQTLCYTGIYRFLNNPDCITGYMGLYGAALICQSFTVFVLALISHACQLVFLYLVEIPHMNRLYSQSDQLRSSTPAVNALNKLKQHVTSQLINESESARQLKHELDSAEDKLKAEIRKIRMKASTEILSLYKRVAEKRQHDNDGSDDNTVQLHAPEQLNNGEALHIQYTTNADHSDTDWIGVYPLDTPSVPSSSDGRWLYVPLGSSGSLCFPPTLLPQADGLYEVRYHRNNQYDIVASIPLVISNNLFSPRNGAPTPNGTPRPAHSKLQVTT